MKRFTNILVVNDPSASRSSGLWRAVDLARANNARLTLLDVIPELPVSSGTTVAGVDVEVAILKERRKRLDLLLEPIRAEGVPVTAVVRTGRPFVEIIRKVLRDGHDLVVKTARGPSGLRGRLFGTTALHLMRKCPCPVWIVKPGARAPHRRILAAVDPTAGAEGAALDRTILELTTSLAQREESEPHIFHAWNADESLLSGRLPRDFVEDAIGKTRERHEALLEELIRHHDDRNITHRIHLERGPAGPGIVAAAKEIGADLIVMGTVGRTGIPGLFIGSTAEDVLENVDCSLLTVKPVGFVSPVTLENADHYATA